MRATCPGSIADAVIVETGWVGQAALRSGRPCAPPDALLAADTGGFPAFGGQGVAVAGGGIAPPEVSVQAGDIADLVVGGEAVAVPVDVRYEPPTGRAHTASTLL
ncbi:hypothetical protein [Streptomyces sp. SID7805]|uniref:hypothetical protein n=1 Tax=Streptomyces sp. SID7805 TaxID=2690328 RepID=UPI00069C506A|nr:hypothetical protein [Streptomyces sp. SID7805]